jgi:hypothetical protein
LPITLCTVRPRKTGGGGEPEGRPLTGARGKGEHNQYMALCVSAIDKLDGNHPLKSYLNAVKESSGRTALQRNLNLCISRNGIARTISPDFHIHVSASDLFIPTFGPPIFLQQNRQTRSEDYINRSQKHECSN